MSDSPNRTTLRKVLKRKAQEPEDESMIKKSKIRIIPDNYMASVKRKAEEPLESISKWIKVTKIDFDQTYGLNIFANWPSSFDFFFALTVEKIFIIVNMSCICYLNSVASSTETTASSRTSTFR